MSDTPKLADECKRLLDNGWTVAMFKNCLGSYSAVALSKDACAEVGEAIEMALEAYDDTEADNPTGVVLTDDFEPSQALYRLTEKVFGNIV